MASRYTGHTQSDESISEPLSPADSSHATLSTSLTQSLVPLDYNDSQDLHIYQSNVDENELSAILNMLPCTA